jgi:tRNA(Ile)-lysidine synthase
MFFEQFKNFIQQQNLLSSGDKILLTVSGGIDSMVMMSLFSKFGSHCIVAHCNFGLRGDESDNDEKFVNEHANLLGFPFISKRFDTEFYAETNKLSIQMAARELRYEWFRQLAKTHQCKVIAIAHNRDDMLETFFINLGRGTGIKGLTGIQPKNDEIIRPLLFASRVDIEEYSRENNVPFREDSSNSSDKYQRNFIRHQVIPTIEKVFPKFRETLTGNISKFNDTADLYQYALAQIIPQVITKKNSLVYINIAGVLATPSPKTILYEILAGFNFTPLTSEEIYNCRYAEPGKQFFSNTHKLVKDREHFIIERMEESQLNKFYIEQDVMEIKEPLHLEISVYDRTDDFAIIKDNTFAQLDFEKLSFPLILRKWNTGDYFYPLGMTGIKKLSDFFVDLKLSVIDKEKVWILASGSEIVWIVGKRIDNRFKITPETRKILELKVME